MYSRTLIIILALFLAIPALAQFSSKSNNNLSGPQACQSGNCLSAGKVAAATSFPSVPVKGKWEVEDFKATDSSVSCAVVKYDSTVTRPTLHLLCPGPDIFAPLRVHLALTWKHVSEIPGVMKSMLVDMSRSVKFKSKPGNSKAELTLHNPQETRSTKEWITFTDVNVGLVLPQK